MEDFDAVVVDPESPSCDGDEIAIDKRPTKPMPPTPRRGRIEIDLDAGGDIADFLEVMARILRERRRIVITIE